MKASEVIESYVHDVAAYLPRKSRNDVAFELRALLNDELTAKAQAAGRAPDKAMVMEMLAGHGRPADVASRYHQRPALIDATDTHHFVIWTLAGAVVISVLSALSPTKHDESDIFLKWLGALVIVFAIMGWIRRKKPKGKLYWKPNRSWDMYRTHRWLNVLLALLSFIPFTMYAMPRAFADTVFFGVISTDGLELNAAFVGSLLRYATMTGLGLQIAIYFVIAIDGRWRRWTRIVSILTMLGVGMLSSAHMGQAQQQLVFISAKANEVSIPFFGLVSAMMILGSLYEMYREWSRISPAPAPEAVAV